MKAAVVSVFVAVGVLSAASVFASDVRMPTPPDFGLPLGGDPIVCPDEERTWCINPSASNGPDRKGLNATNGCGPTGTSEGCLFPFLWRPTPDPVLQQESELPELVAVPVSWGLEAESLPGHKGGAGAGD